MARAGGEGAIARGSGASESGSYAHRACCHGTAMYCAVAASMHGVVGRATGLPCIHFSSTALGECVRAQCALADFSGPCIAKRRRARATASEESVPFPAVRPSLQLNMSQYV